VLGFGVAFATGHSTYLVKSVTLLVSTMPMEAAFEGRLEASLYRLSEGAGVPDGEPLATSGIDGVTIPQREKYATIPVSFPLLEPNTSYAIVLRAPNSYLSRILGYQVPDVSPTPIEGLSMGLPFYGSQKSGWKRLMNPYIWVQGWRLDDPMTRRRVTHWKIGLGAAGLLAIALVFWGRIRFKANNAGRSR
jgi:hypothetical protein